MLNELFMCEAVVPSRIPKVERKVTEVFSTK